MSFEGGSVNKTELKKEIMSALNEIHENVFVDVDINRVIEQDNLLNDVLEKYVEYFDYIDNNEAYNVTYCFKIARQDLSKFYDNQEQKLNNIINDPLLRELDHNINEHIYEEVTVCQEKVKNLYHYTMGITFISTFGLIFLFTEIAHLLETHNFLEITLLALVITISKMVIDKKFVTKLVTKNAWKYFKLSIRRSLAFYFTSDILLEYLSNHKINAITEEQLQRFKDQVRTSIDIILKQVI